MSRKNTKTMRGLIPLAITQFLSARYQNADPEPGCSSGATGTPDSSASRRSSTRVPAIESPMMT